VGNDLYPTLESKASHLLYFIVKNHSFIDGNKRIGAFIFIWFLDLNKRLFDAQGKKIISEETLVALTLMIAQSKPHDKEMIVKVIINLIS
jgi:prophage maintenance system killer protein